MYLVPSVPEDFRHVALVLLLKIDLDIQLLFILTREARNIGEANITVCHVISLFAPDHGHSKWHCLRSTSEPSSKIDSTSSTANVRSPFLVLITSLATKIQLMCFLNKSSHNASLRLNRELSTNIAECIPAAETLARNFRSSLNSR